MPIYSYRCNNCGETFDKLVKPGSNGRVSCIHCQSEARRVFSPVGIIFKGSGFYSTDYKSGNSNIKDTSAGKQDQKKKEENKPGAVSGTKEKKAEKTGSGK